jgi:hypothetical protein
MLKKLNTHQFSHSFSATAFGILALRDKMFEAYIHADSDLLWGAPRNGT